MNLSLKQHTLLAVFALSMVLAGEAQATRVDGLYTAEVPLVRNTAAGRADGFSEALAAVLVKVTGQEILPEDKAGRLGNAAALVQQYRAIKGQRIEVSFDPAALRRQLDAAELPVWSAERPAVMIWLAIDEGQGRRSVLGTAGEFSLASSADEYRGTLYATADARGLPIILPLLDGEDLSNVSTSDVWGGFGDVLLEASRRYSADVTLVGRLRQAGAQGAQVRWSLFVAGSQTLEWVGDLAAGPRVTADILGKELATFAAETGAITLTVRDIYTLDDYARVLNYLRSLAIVEQVSVARVIGGAVEFSVTARSDSERLDRDIRRDRLLTPWSDTSAPAATPENIGDWVSYRVADDGLVYSIKE